ncbi:hypothetical protein CY35_13G059100 [Sphagnum magellanicum]|nr:hypothetical protein CY35_13G059100 [Sphagnum magellanicum]
MAKTKHKQLAVLAAIKEVVLVTHGEHMVDPEEQSGCSSKPTLREHSPEIEVKQQRVIIWIPSANPSSEASTNGIAEVLTNGTSSRKGKHLGDKALAPGNESGKIDKIFSKVIFKVGNGLKERIVQEAGSSIEAVPVGGIEKCSQRPRTKAGAHTSQGKKRKAQSTVLNMPSSCEVDRAIPFANSQDPPGEAQGVAKDCNVEGELLTESPTILSKRNTPRRKASSLKGLLAAYPLFESHPEQREEPPMSSTAEVIMVGEEQAFFENKEGTTYVRKQDNFQERRQERVLGISSRHSKRLAKESSSKESLIEPGQPAVESSARDFQLRKTTDAVKKVSGLSGMIFPIAVAQSTVDVSTDPQIESFVVKGTENPPQAVMNLWGSSKRDGSGRMAPMVDTSLRQHSATPQSLPLSMSSPLKEALPSVGRVQAVVQSQSRLLRSGRMIGLQPEAIPSVPMSSKTSTYTLFSLPNSSVEANSSNRHPAPAQASDVITVQDAEKNIKLPAPDGPSVVANGFKAAASGSDLTCGMKSNTVACTGLLARSFRVLRDKEARHKANHLPVQHVYHGKIGSGVGKVNGQASEKLIRSTTCIQDKEVIFPGIKWNSQEEAGIHGAYNILAPKLSNGSMQIPTISDSELALSKQVNRVAVVEAKLEEVGGLTDWLVQHGLGVFVGLFEERNIDEEALVQLTMEALKEMGVYAVGPRRKLIWAIQNL